jgi:hypothetical protein
MGSYENIVKIEEMRKRMEEGDAASAQKILDTIEIKKIKNMSDLSLIAEVYTENERYEEAVRLFLKIYEKTKSRKSLFQLVDLSIKTENISDARYYLGEYQKLAPRDFYKYIFRYRIDLLSKEPYETLIDTLETLKRTEYLEQWAYELAKTYYKAGMEKECIRECSDIILWFGEGNYVEKARILRSYFSGETDKQKIIEQLKRRVREDEGQDAESDGGSRDQEYELPEEGNAAGAEPDAGEEETVLAEAAATDEEADFEDSLRRDIQSMLTDEEEQSQGEWEESETSEEEAGTWEAADMSETEDTDGDTDIDTSLEEEGGIYEETNAEEDEGIYEETNAEEEAELDEEMNMYGEADTEETETEEYEFEDELGIEEESEAGAYYRARNNREQPTVSGRLSDRELAEQEVEKALYQLLEEEDMDEEDRKLQQLTLELGFELEAVFYNFLHIKSVKKELVKCLEGMLDPHGKTVQIIITGTEGSGKTTLAKDITMFLNKAGKLKSSKIAKIKADKLNTLEVMSKKETLKDCCLVVENASELKRETIDGILELCRVLRGNIAVIFEENKQNIDKLFREYPKLMDLFKNRIHLPGYTPEDLTGFADACLKQQGYRLSAKAESVLIHKIRQIGKQPESQMHLRQIDELMQTVMNAADVRTGRQSSNLVSQGRLDEVEVLTVMPEDFAAKP